MDRLLWRFGESVVQRPAGGRRRWRCRGHRRHAPEFSRARRHTPAWSTDDRLVFFDNTAGRCAAAGGRRRQRRQEIRHRLGRRRNGTPRITNTITTWSGRRTTRISTFVSGSVRDWNHTKNEMDIWRIRTLRRNAGATDLPEHLADLPGDARSGHARLRRP